MDTDLKSTIKPFVSKAHPIVKELLLSDDFEDIMRDIVKDYNLNIDESSDLNDFVCSILIGITSPEELFEGVAKITSLPQVLSDDLAVAIQNIVLDTIASKIEGWGPVIPKSNIGQSFEQIMADQAKAMQPARPAGSSQVVTNNQPSTLGTATTQNLTSENNTEKPKFSVPNYSGQDPYREPLE